MKTTRTEYFYDDSNNLSRVVTTETMDCAGCDEGELLTSEIDFTEDGPTFADAALALAGLGLCLTAVAAIFKRH